MQMDAGCKAGRECYSEGSALWSPGALNRIGPHKCTTVVNTPCLGRPVPFAGSLWLPERIFQAGGAGSRRWCSSPAIRAALGYAASGAMLSTTEGFAPVFLCPIQHLSPYQASVSSHCPPAKVVSAQTHRNPPAGQGCCIWDTMGLGVPILPCAGC